MTLLEPGRTILFGALFMFLAWFSMRAYAVLVALFGGVGEGFMRESWWAVEKMGAYAPLQVESDPNFMGAALIANALLLSAALLAVLGAKFYMRAVGMDYRERLFDEL